MLATAQRLTESGRHAAALDYLGSLAVTDLEQSPALALLYGIAQARLGRHDDGQRWANVALSRARERGDSAVEARALNVLGAIAFETGRIDDAAEHFRQGAASSERIGDHETLGRCSNNLGSVAHLRGEYARAINSYTTARTAFERANLSAGIAETLHNLAMTYRDLSDRAKALETANRAVEKATEAGDLSLVAHARGGRAEIRLLAGEPAAAQPELEQALVVHRKVGNVVGEANDLRVLAGVRAELGETEEAERLLRDVIERANRYERPLLAAQAERDLARLLHRAGRTAEAGDWARRAQAHYRQLGAEAEVRSLDQLMAAR